MKKSLLALFLVFCLMLTACGKKDQAVFEAEVMIKAIKTVTIASGEDIATAERFYNKLTEAQKSQVENYETLRQAREAYDALVICGEWVWFTGDRSTTLTLGEDGRFAMSDGISGTYTVTDTAVELLINGTGDPVKLTKEQRNNLMHLTTPAVDYVRPDVLTVESDILTSNNWDRFFEVHYHLHVEKDSLGTVTDYWHCYYLHLKEEYVGLAAPGTEIAVTARCTGRDMRALYDTASDQVMLLEELTAPAEITATVNLTETAFEETGCCPMGHELIKGASSQYQNTVFRVLRYLEDIEITELTGRFSYYGQLVK